MKRIAVGIGVVAITIAGWFFLRGDPDVRAINKAFDQLTVAAQWERREDLLRAGLAARNLVTHCARDIVLDVNDIPFRISNRGELQSAFAHARTRVDSLVLEVKDREVELGPERASAEMFVTAYITVQYDRDTASGLRSVRLEWKKTEGEWRLSRVESYETIGG